MKKLRAFFLRFGRLFGKPRRDRDLDEEIESHLQLHMEDGLREGLTPTEARRRAMVQLLFQSGEQDDAKAFAVVGVVGAVKQAELMDNQAQGAVYFPYRHRAADNLYGKRPMEDRRSQGLDGAESAQATRNDGRGFALALALRSAKAAGVS